LYVSYNFIYHINIVLYVLYLFDVQIVFDIIATFVPLSIQLIISLLHVYCTNPSHTGVRNSSRLDLSCVYVR